MSHLNCQSGFPYFLQFKPEFCYKVIMIWATVSSRSCFFWLYRASPSSATKNIIHLISALTVWWCPCVELSLCVVERGCFLWPMCSLGKTLLPFALLHLVLQGQTCLLLQVSRDHLLLHSKYKWVMISLHLLGRGPDEHVEKWTWTWEYILKPMSWVILYTQLCSFIIVSPPRAQ